MEGSSPSCPFIFLPGAITMKMKTLLCALAITAMASFQLNALQATHADPQTATKKLAAFLGRWQTEATINGEKASSMLECRWSPKGSFLVCEQVVSLPGGQQQTQLTVYSYSPKDGSYIFSTFSNPGEKPSSGSVVIDGNVWTYAFSFSADGKTTLIRTINEFPAPGTENFKTEVSPDGGATWKVILQGTGRRISD